jgi:hypothetical protein
MVAPMRLWLVLAPLLLAGCTQPAEPMQPAAPSALPPSLLLDRTVAGTLQLYVHAKQGNVRYDFINVTEWNDFQPNVTWSNRTSPREDAYALDLDVGRGRATFAVEVVEGDTHYAWGARVALNDTARPPSINVAAMDPDGSFGAARDVALPYEKLLPRAEAR